MPIELIGIAGIAAMGVAFYLVRNWMLTKANSGQEIPLVGKQKREWVNALTGGTLVAAVLTLAVFGLAEQGGYVTGPVALMKAIPAIGAYIPFSAAAVPSVPTTTLPANPYQPTTPSGPTSSCIGLAQTPAVTVNVNDAQKPGLNVAEASQYRKKGQSSWSAFMPGSKISAIGAAGEVYQMAVCLNQSALTGTCYGPVFDYTVKCQEEDKVQKAAYNDAANSDVTSTFYNEDEQAAAQSMQAGSSATVFLQFESVSDTVFGNPYIGDYLTDVNGQRAAYPNVLMLQLNKTTMKKPDKVWVFQSPVSSEVNVQLKQVGCPNIADTTSETTNYCYEAPVIRDSRTRVAVKLVADSNHAPDVDQTAFVYTGSFYVNTDTGELAWGVEDNNNAKVGSAAAESLTIDLTP